MDLISVENLNKNIINSLYFKEKLYYKYPYNTIL